MDEVQIIKSPSGEEMVVLPRSRYEELLAAAGDADEDAADIAALDQALADIASGRDAILPVEVSAFILGGDSLPRALRKWRGLTQVELAEKAGVGQGYLSDIESRRRIGTDETLTRIAAALDVPATWLIRTEAERRDDPRPL